VVNGLDIGDVKNLPIRVNFPGDEPDGLASDDGCVGVFAGPERLSAGERAGMVVGVYGLNGVSHGGEVSESWSESGFSGHLQLRGATWAFGFNVVRNCLSLRSLILWLPSKGRRNSVRNWLSCSVVKLPMFDGKRAEQILVFVNQQTHWENHR